MKVAPKPRIRRSQACDLAAVLDLLNGAGLPTEDLTWAPGLQVWVVEAEGLLVGLIGLERFGAGGLLRSLVVAAGHQRRGLGQELVAQLERDARAEGVEQLVLLTQTSEPFFRLLGYSIVDRRYVPDELKQSEEFRSLCPASAVCMTKSLVAQVPELRVAEPRYNVLFLCTGNSARSILAEALTNYWGKHRFRAYSAGSHPTGKVNPYALQLLQDMAIPIENPRSKTWDEFASPDAPTGAMDFVITVCDSAAGQVCPLWPSHPMTAHWGMEDPAAVKGNDAETAKAFRHAFETLQARIKAFVSLPIGQLGPAELKAQVREIGKLAAGVTA
jgi:protein-tyrosine-phosphatase/N-acetylglutamate synthase-like GNAT family acetyltransferase